MTERRETGSKPKPARSAEGLAESTAREARLAEALRANLARRKAQSRGRAEATDPNRSDERGEANTSAAPPARGGQHNSLK